MLSRSRLNYRPLVRLIIFALSLGIITFTVGGCKVFQPSYDAPEAKAAFQNTIETPLDPDIHLLTEKKRYHREDYIGLWVENDSNNTVLFHDQSLGVTGYQYNQESKTWHMVDLGFKVGDPRTTIIEPGPRSPLSSFVIPVRRIKASGPLRLVITGITDQEELFAAYKDIEIVD